MNNIEQSLEFLWMKKEEVKIYLCLLEYWSLAISSISKITWVKRVNCYHYCDKLLDSWYILISKKHWNKVFSAENPKVFINKEKEKLNIIENILPNLISLSEQNTNKPNIIFFEWEKWIKQIFSKIEELKNVEIVSFSSFSRLSKFFSQEDFLQKHLEKRISQKVKTRFISPKEGNSKETITKLFPKFFDKSLLEIFLISSNNFFFDSEITIFDEHIAILNLSGQNPIWIIIQDKSLYKTQKAIFDLAWLWATSFIS